MVAGAPVPPQFASLYVGDLHPDTTEAMLYEIFNAVGPVGSIRVCRDTVTRKSLGYGYVNFHNVSDAERALETLNYSSIKGRACRIGWSQRDPSLRKSGVGNIVVKNLDRNIDNKALFDTFSLFGNIHSCKVACDPMGKSWGYGFVQYETEEAAKQAIERVHGMQIGEKTVEAYAYKKRTERELPSGDNFTNLYVKGLGTEMTDDKFKELFEPFGAVTSCALMEDKKGRKFGFVNFEKHEEAQAAIEGLKGKDLRTDEEKEATPEGADPEDYLLYVGRAQTKAERFKANTAGAARDGGVNLYVKNLSEDVDDDALKELFKPYGDIMSAASMKGENGKCKGFGFVCFAQADEATKAVTGMHLRVVDGKPLYVGLAERKEQRQERLKNRYTAPTGGATFHLPGVSKGKGGGKAAPIPMGMPAMTAPMPGGAMLPPQFMQMMSAKGMMCNPVMGAKGMPTMGKGTPMMGNQIFGMMGSKGNILPPQMMQMLGKGNAPMGMMMRPMMPMPGMRPNMPTGGSGPAESPAAQPAQQQGTDTGGDGLVMDAPPPQFQKQILGEQLFPLVYAVQPTLAGKITGMMLEMDNNELRTLLKSKTQLQAKISEAMEVLSKSASS